MKIETLAKTIIDVLTDENHWVSSKMHSLIVKLVRDNFTEYQATELLYSIKYEVNTDGTPTDDTSYWLESEDAEQLYYTLIENPLAF